MANGKVSPAAVKVLYIAGSGRSGSTVLDRILGQLDGFFSAGELENLWQRGMLAGRKCGCGEPFGACPVWTAVLGDAFGGPDGVDARRMVALGRRRTRPAQVPGALAGRPRRPDPGTVEYQRTLERLYLAIQRQTGCRVIVDSSKSPLYARLLAGIPSIELYLVHLVRDPRATAYSFQRRKRLPDFGDERLMQRQPPLTSARRWGLWQAATELLWRGRPDRYLRVRYEDFVRAPAEVVGRVAELVGERPAELPFQSDATVWLGPTHSVSGNPNRFATGPVEVRPDDQWVERMGRADRLLVTAVTWPLLLHYRYRLRPVGRWGGP
jgi:hypothetical protein